MNPTERMKNTYIVIKTYNKNCLFFFLHVYYAVEPVKVSTEYQDWENIIILSVQEGLKWQTFTRSQWWRMFSTVPSRALEPAKDWIWIWIMT